MNTELYVLRHGQTDWNKRGALQGQLNTALNAAGLQQAQQAQQRLAGLSFDAVYTSPLQRAAQTAHIVTADFPLSPVPDERLLEIGFGIWEGLDVASLGAAIQPFFDTPDAYCPPEGGETLDALLVRAKDFLADIRQRHAGQRVLAVSHSAFMHSLLLAQDDRPLSTFWTPRFGNCAILRFSGSDMRGEVLWHGVAPR